MQRYMLRRIINLIPVLVLISIVVFSTVRVLPGDPARLLAAIDETGFVDPEVLAAVEKRYGLDKPVVTQYFEWVWGVMRGDWGVSLISSQDVFPQIRSRLSFTAQLAGLSWLLSMAIGIPMGVISALKRNSIRDIAVTSFAVSGIALPNFWLGMLMIIFFGVWLGWLPTGGYTSFQDSPIDWARKMILPTITLGTALSAVTMRQMRAALLEVMREDYIRTARAKGLMESRVVLLHAMKNSLLPVITLSTLQLGTLVGGTVVTETVFFLPGIGKFIVDAVIAKDFLVVQMGLMILTLGVLVANLIADVSYAFLDPRIRFD
ncbi:Glutathione transport system permease protein GsiC [Geodia barretti]|uniref:Glutathione transport system permease protein GsiC n=1 Tax=Geodia barretti TaxID=519541 RepID=A0AA35RBZ5_GEOBA|nr:Glutathione transport system permease protein GsiC [Geodia barretti]